MRERLTARGLCPAGAPERFVRASVLRTLAQWEIVSSPELVEDLTQEGLLACWTRGAALGRTAIYVNNVSEGE